MRFTQEDISLLIGLVGVMLAIKVLKNFQKKKRRNRKYNLCL